jgi:cell division protein YceG involved in septum cleavage
MMPAPILTGSRVVRRLLALIVLAVIALGGAAYWWLNQPLQLAGAGTQALELAIEPGTTPRGIARDAVAAGVRTDARLLYAWFRFSGQDRAIKAGNYEIPPGTTPIGLLRKLARGEEALRALTLVEGWNWRQVRQALAREERPQLMCPLNEEGRCSLYLHRLMICRMHGVPSSLTFPNGQTKKLSRKNYKIYNKHKPNQQLNKHIQIMTQIMTMSLNML